MAETMLQVFQRHRDCFDFTKEPNPTASTEARQMCYERQQEREQAANEYVNGILTANDNWADDINEDTNKLALSFQGILNKAERKAYREAAGQFLHYVASALREHRVRQLSPLTRYRMGSEEFPAMNIVTGLSRDEAAREYQRMKGQGFAKVYYFPTEAFPAVFTVLGYKPNGSKPHEPQKNAHSDTDSEGMGNNTPNGSETPPAGKETPKKRISRTFKEFVKNQEQADSIISAIRDLMEETTTTKEKAKVIVACTDLWINKPTAPSVKEAFNIEDSVFSTYKDCITFHYEPTNSRAPKKGFPFPENELEDIREKIREKIEKK